MDQILRRVERGAGEAADLTVLEDIGAKMEGGTICSFADAAVWPIQGLLRHFRDEFEAHNASGGCPHAGSFAL